MSLLTNLVAHWKLNEASGTRNDAHSNGYHLTDNNTVGSGTGKIGDAADFIKANSEHLSRSSIPAELKVGTFDWTIALWVNPDLAESTGFFRWAGATSDLDAVMAASRTIRCTVLDSGGSGTVKESTDTLTTGAWNFVLVSYDAAAQEFRIRINNGTEKTFAQASIRNTNTIFHLGLSFASFSNALIDSVSFWNRVLTSTEEDDLYNGGAGLDYEDFDGGGATHEGSTAESVTAADAPSALATFVATAAESVSAAEAVTAVTAFGVAAHSETLSAADAPAAAAVFVSAAGETLTAAESSDAYISIDGACAESGNASESCAASAVLAGAMTETLTAADGCSATVIAAGSCAESLTATETCDWIDGSEIIAPASGQELEIYVGCAGDTVAEFANEALTEVEVIA